MAHLFLNTCDLISLSDFILGLHIWLHRKNSEKANLREIRGNCNSLGRSLTLNRMCNALLGIWIRLDHL